MRRNVFTATLRDDRRTLLVWAVAFAAVTSMYSSIYPSIQDSVSTVAKDYPSVLKEALHLGELDTAAGYLSSTVLGVLLPVLMSVFAISTGSRHTAGSEERGALELLLSCPLSRMSFLAQRAGALILSIGAYGLAVFLALMVIGHALGLGLATANVASAALQLVLLGLVLGLVSFSIGAATGRPGVAIGAAALFAVLAYMANAFAQQVDALAWSRFLSPFYYYAGGRPLQHGFQWEDALVLAAAAATAFIPGAVRFCRRDIGV